MDTFIYEEYILQTIVVIIFTICLLVAVIIELIEENKPIIDDLTKKKLKKIYQFAYELNFNGNKEEAKRKSIAFVKEVHKKKLINEKYDLIKGV